MKRLICCKVILLILSIGLSCCCVYGKDKLSKTEKQALKWLEKGEKLDNGVVRITLPGDYLSLLNDEKVLKPLRQDPCSFGKKPTVEMHFTTAFLSKILRHCFLTACYLALIIR